MHSIRHLGASPESNTTSRDDFSPSDIRATIQLVRSYGEKDTMSNTLDSTTSAASRHVVIAPFVNPYAGHRLLSEKEQEVLGEYARLAATIKRVSQDTEEKL